jgi:uncharacterized protein (TIGR00661 family)
MARIFYGVQGDANGHINRSLSVAELLTGHEVLFAGGGAAVRARDAGFAFEELPLVGMLVRDNTVQWAPTIANFIGKRVSARRWINRLKDIITAFDPDLILTDNEYFTPRAARILGRPCYSLDHQHVLSRTRYATPPGQTIPKLTATGIMRFFLPGLQGCLIVSFHRPPLVDPRKDAVFGTVPRPDALAVRPETGEHALMYVPGCDADKIAKLFGRRKREYRIYGLGERPAQGNLTFRKPGRRRFLEDFASAAYVVACGGHGLLTEALLFGKPCLLFPGRFLYEQFWNCHFVREKGFGRYYTSFVIDPKEVDAFETSLDACRTRIAAEDCNGRMQLKKHLESLPGMSVRQ